MDYNMYKIQWLPQSVTHYVKSNIKGPDMKYRKQLTWDKQPYKEQINVRKNKFDRHEPTITTDLPALDLGQAHK